MVKALPLTDETPIVIPTFDWSYFTEFKEAALGDLIDISEGENNMGVDALHKLASYIFYNVRGVNYDTPCKYSSSATRKKAIIVGDKIYRQSNGVLFEESCEKANLKKRWRCNSAH